ncbi:MAG: hypothetical protein DRO15_02670 [Thermoprotei archaeon]|nr:MAG: hypothetical protein DRO15_02670 [Thermoprotei archaeon]
MIELAHYQLWTSQKPSSIVIEPDFILALILIIIGLLLLVAGFYRRKHVSLGIIHTGVEREAFENRRSY